MRTQVPFAALAIALAAGMLVSSANPLNASAQVGDRKPLPGEGVLCSWAILINVAEASRKCHAGEHPEFQAELDRSVARLDAYALANTMPPITPGDIEQFKRDQGHRSNT